MGVKSTLMSLRPLRPIGSRRPPNFNCPTLTMSSTDRCLGSLEEQGRYVEIDASPKSFACD